VFVGTVTAVGGGAARDLLTNETPTVFLPGELYATAAFAGALAYPLVSLSGGLPRFPSQAECVRIAKSDGDLEAVFGRFRREGSAAAMLARVRKVGFAAAQIEPDGCGNLAVALHGITTLRVGRSLVAEAQHAGFRPTLESVAP
jgi:hypothetical protein